MLNWNIALWLDVPGHMATCNPSECFISALHSNAIIKFVYVIGPGVHRLAANTSKDNLPIWRHVSKKSQLIDWQLTNKQKCHQ